MQRVLIETERKLYTLAIGCLALAVLVVAEVNFWPDFHGHRYLLHALLRVFRKPVVLIHAQVILLEIVCALVCLPFLKATRERLSFVDALILSLPLVCVFFVNVRCGGMGSVISAIAMPLIFFAVFRILPLRFIRSFVDDPPTHDRPVLRLSLAFALAVQFMLLSLVLSGATRPFRIGAASVVFLLGVVTALAARLRPRVYLVLIALAAFAFNTYVTYSTVTSPKAKTYWESAVASFECERPPTSTR